MVFYLYNAFLCIAAHCLPIHPFALTLLLGVQCLVQGHLNMWTGERNRTSQPSGEQVTCSTSWATAPPRDNLYQPHWKVRATVAHCVRLNPSKQGNSEETGFGLLCAPSRSFPNNLLGYRNTHSGRCVHLHSFFWMYTVVRHHRKTNLCKCCWSASEQSITLFLYVNSVHRLKVTRQLTFLKILWCL